MLHSDVLGSDALEEASSVNACVPQLVSVLNRNCSREVQSKCYVLKAAKVIPGFFLF